MLQPSTIQLLRIHFSYFLMPVFWFAMVFVPDVNLVNAALAFFILHLLVYPSSNGYNSYMDRDTSAVGGIKNPKAPTRQLFVVTVILDITAILLSLLVSTAFCACIACYIICSRLYSYRGVRLKKFPIAGYLTVIINQGCLVFFMVYLAANGNTSGFPYLAMISAGFLIGGFYPITQVYQHQQDAADKVTTISMLLGVKGTFVFCAVMYGIAFVTLFFALGEHLTAFVVLQIFFLPVIAWFLYWCTKVWKDANKADFEHTMRMNWLASSCSNAAFISILILQHFG